MDDGRVMNNHKNKLKNKVCFSINKDVLFYPCEHKLLCLSDINNSKEAININVPASRCLMLLIENRRSVVSKEDFFNHVWKAHGRFVAQNTYYQNISLLRRSLKSVGLEQMIITVPRQGLKISEDIHIEEVIIDNDAELFTLTVDCEGRKTVAQLTEAQYPAEGVSDSSKRSQIYRIVSYITTLMNKKISVIYLIFLFLIVFLLIVIDKLFVSGGGDLQPIYPDTEMSAPAQCSSVSSVKSSEK